MNEKFELIQVAGRPTSIISLPNGNLVYCSLNSVKSVDENFTEIKSFSICGLSFFFALNRRNEIYVSESSKHCIISFDLNLNQLKQFGSIGADNRPIRLPTWFVFSRRLFLHL